MPLFAGGKDGTVYKKIQMKRALKEAKRKRALKAKLAKSEEVKIYEALLSPDIWEMGIGIGVLAQRDGKGGLHLSCFKIDT